MEIPDFSYSLPTKPQVFMSYEQFKEKYFNYLAQVYESYKILCAEQNIPPSNFERVCLNTYTDTAYNGWN